MGGSAAATIGRIALIAVGNYIAPGIGGVLGAVAGNFLFPQKLPDIEGPRLTDQGITTSTNGATIPIVYGTITVAGNIIWDGGLVETKHEEDVGGKGGPTQEVTSYTYSRSFALGLCEGEIAGVRRIWANAKVIYDTRVQQEGESDEDFASRIDASAELEERMTIYLGTETQTADPLIEADKGAGNVPGFRGLAYLVFEDYDVTDLAGRPPTFVVEVYTQLGPEEELDYLVDPKWVGYPERGTSDYPIRISENTIQFVKPFNNVVYSRPDIAFTINMGGALWKLDGSEQLSGSAMSFGVDEPAAGTYGGLLDALTISVSGHVINCPSMISIGAKSWYGTLGTVPPQQKVIWFSGGFEMVDIVPGIGDLYSEVASAQVNICNWFDNAIYISFPATSIRNKIHRWPTSPFGIPGSSVTTQIYNATPYGSLSTPTLESLCGDRDRLYVLVSADITVLPTFAYYLQEIDPETLDPLRRWLLADGTTWISGDDLGVLVHGDFVAIAPSSDGNRRLLIWELNDDAPLVGEASGAGTSTLIVNDASEFFDSNPGAHVFVDERLHRMKVRDRWIKLPNGINVGPVTLGDIVSDVCDRTGMSASDYDVSELTEVVDGYRIERVTTGRGAIDPLRSFGFFDAIESAGQIKFPLRGKGSVATLGADDLSAHEDGGETPPLVSLERTEDVELPRLTRVHYLMPHAEYQIGEQKSSRLITDAVSAMDVDLAIAMTDDKAAEIAEVLLAEAWIGRESYKAFVSPRWLALEPSDAVVLPVEGENQRARIASIQIGMPGLLEIECLRDDQIIYDPTAVGVPSGITEQPLGLAGDTLMIMVDGPALVDAHNEPGLYVAARGTGGSWTGAGIYESLDSGSNYARVLTVTGASTMGFLESALPTGPSEIWDDYNTVVVSLDSGTLESRTEEAVLNGANAAFIGGPGRWEVIQFRTATLISTGRYRISGFLRGRRGTEHAMGDGVAGDAFVLCSTVTRLPLGNGAINQSRLYKAVTFGQLIESAGTYTVTPTGVALECFSPVHVDRIWDNDTTDIAFKWKRRARLSAEWLDGADVPLNEATESYEIDVMSGTTVLRTLTATSQTATYTTAQQVADGLSPGGTITIQLYQLSAIVGRGYVTEATI